MGEPSAASQVESKSSCSVLVGEDLSAQPSLNTIEIDNDFPGPMLADPNCWYAIATGRIFRHQKIQFKKQNIWQPNLAMETI